MFALETHAIKVEEAIVPYNFDPAVAQLADHGAFAHAIARVSVYVLSGPFPVEAAHYTRSQYHMLLQLRGFAILLQKH